jgi:ATP-dependent DNA helicase RecG
MNENKYINEVLEKYELESVHEMIYELLPRGYNIPAAFADISEINFYPAKTKVTVFGYIQKYELQNIKSKRGLVKIKARLFKDGNQVSLFWTTSKAKANAMVYGLTQKSKDDALVQVTGKIEEIDFGNSIFKYIAQPELTRIDNKHNENNNQSVLVPEAMYRLKEGIKISQMKFAFQELIRNWDSIYKNNFLPEELEKKLKLQPLKKSIQYCHGQIPIPAEKFNDFLNYPGFRKRLLIEKIWTIMKTGHSNKQLGGNNDFNINDKDISNIKTLLSLLPFELTGDQKKAIWGLLKHYEEKIGSKNLVFGDVGSGKTMVALVVAYILYKRGYQIAIMAPTSILAKQHYEEAFELLKNENIFIVHSKTKKKEKDNINNILKNEEPAIVFGTSSINKLDFTNLKLIVVDEEQKFGVKDKNKLYEKMNGQAHIVLMTATPIPRTLANAMFSDYSIQKIEEKPAMQKPRITKLANLSTMPKEEINSIKERMRNGEQTLVIVPSIISNDMVSVKSAKELFSKVFHEFKIDSINGRMKPDNIEKVTESFMSGNIDILIATTMVDAGFSNKMLSHVFIENSERFGIAQLHQIRGRVGRGSLQGYCYLSTAADPGILKENTRKRLNSLVESENGFELSMKDIELRGSGDLMGTQQSGSEVNLIEWINEVKIIEEYIKGNLKDFN